MRRLTLLALVFALALTLNPARANAQAGGASEREAQASTITVAAAGGRVRFTAPGNVVRIQVQVYSESGDALFDASSKGNVFDWTLQDGSGQRVADGDFLCVVTVKSLSGKISQRVGAVSVQGVVVTLRAEAARLTGAQQQAVGPVEENAALTMLQESSTRAATVATHDGRDGQLTATEGALTFRTGDVFAGQDKEHMRITEDGRVGIGTDKPEATLDVAGAVRASGGFKFPDGTTLTTRAGRLSLTSEAGEELPGPSAAGTGTQNRLAKWAETGGAGALTDSVVAESGGNIGIGTSTPTGKFHLHSGAGQAADVRMTSDAISSPFTFGGALPNNLGARFTFAGVNEGGFAAQGFTDANAPAFRFQGHVGSTSPTQIPVIFEGFKSNGAGDRAPLAGAEKVFGFYNGAFDAGGTVLMAMTGNGNVGIGTTTPASLLDVNGGGRFAPGGSGGSIQLGSPNGETGLSISNASTRADLRFDGASVRLLAGPASGPPAATSGVSVNTLGNVGIGTSNPPTAKLHVLTTTASLPAVYAESPNRGVWGVSTGSSYGLYGESVSGIGAQGVSTSNIGVGGISSTNVAVAGTSGSSIGVRGQTGSTSVAAPGVQGVSTGAGGVGVRGDGTTGVYGVSTGGVGVTGEANAAGSTGVYGTSTSGYAVYANGNAGQALGKGGFVKAMLLVDPFRPADQYVVRCYNGLTNSSTGNCGFTVTRVDVGDYRINFGAGFNVADRFISFTAFSTVAGGDVSPHVDPTTVGVETWTPVSGGIDHIDAAFYLIVY